MVLLCTLCQLYIEALENTLFTNQNFSREKLKGKLEQDPISSKTRFTKAKANDKDCLPYNLIFSADISLEDVAVQGYNLGRQLDASDREALQLRENALETFKSGPGLPWPLTTKEFDESVETILPCRMVKFVNTLLTG